MLEKKKKRSEKAAESEESKEQGPRQGPMEYNMIYNISPLDLGKSVFSSAHTHTTPPSNHNSWREEVKLVGVES